jgi:hypothetical protein
MTISVRFDGVAREGVGRGEVAQVRHGACRWSLETSRGCAGPPGPDLAKRDLNPRIPARVMTISVRFDGVAREGVGRGEVAQVRHGACRWSLETSRGCAGPPGPDLAKRDLNPRIPARVMTISVRFDGVAREGVGRGEVAQVRHGACRWSLETSRGCAGPPGPDLAKRDLNPRIPARVMTISVRFDCVAREGVGRGEVAQVRHGACRWSLETSRGCAGPPGPDLAKRDLNPRIPARVMTISVRFDGVAREGVGRGEVAQVRHGACRWSLETSRGCAGPPGPDLRINPGETIVLVHFRPCALFCILETMEMVSMDHGNFFGSPQTMWSIKLPRPCAATA